MQSGLLHQRGYVAVFEQPSQFLWRGLAQLDAGKSHECELLVSLVLNNLTSAPE